MPPHLRFSPSLAFALLLVGCFRPEASDPGQPQGGMPLNAARPYKETVALNDVYTGRFEAVEEVELRSRVSGYLESVHFDEGTEVEAGALMFQIDPRTFKAQVENAQARVQQTKAAMQLAKVTLDRAETLVKDNAISRQEYDLRTSEATQAQADVTAAEAELRRAQLDLEFAEIRAPISGIAGEYQVTPGNLISGGTVGATLLTTIVPHNPIYCYFEADERQVLKFTRMFFEGKTGGRGSELKVQIALTDQEDFPFEGVINFADNKLDDSTATMRLRAKVKNENSFLTPGLFARVKVPLGDPEEVLLVQDSALGFDQTERYAWVIKDDNTVERRFLQVGRQQGMMRIVYGGLTESDLIAVSSVQLLQEGAPVTPNEVPMNPEKEAVENAPSATGEEATNDAAAQAQGDKETAP